MVMKCEESKTIELTQEIITDFKKESMNRLKSKL